MICAICGGSQFLEDPVLWPDLIQQWNLSPAEVDYIDRQQGMKCQFCFAGWRSIGLADSVMKEFGFIGLFRDFVESPTASEIKVLEINPAGQLTPWLRQMPQHRLVEYPEVDIQKMPFADSEFDLVIHSDTLEHIPDPLKGLAECSRVLKPGGRCIFTVPIVLNRVSRTRTGLPPSYHGNASNPSDYLVFTEFGADAWIWPIRSGFESCKIRHWDFPSVCVLIAQNSTLLESPRAASFIESDRKPAENTLPGKQLNGLNALERHRLTIAQSFAQKKDVLTLAKGDNTARSVLAQVAQSVVDADFNHDQKVLPLRDHSMDLVVCFDALLFSNHPDDLVKEIHRILRSDGILLICAANNAIFRPETVGNKVNVRQPPLESLLQLLRRHFPRVEWASQHSLTGSMILPTSHSMKTEPLLLLQGNAENLCERLLPESGSDAILIATPGNELPAIPWGAYSYSDSGDRYSLKQATNELEALKSSTSWKITAPIRWVKELVNSILSRRSGSSET